MDLAKFYSQFREETTENVRILNDGLLVLERANDLTDPDTRAYLDASFRAVHTIKGSARLLGFAHIGLLAHKMEDILGAVRAGKLQLNRELTDQLLRSGDILLALVIDSVEGRENSTSVEDYITALERSSNGQPAPPPTNSQEPAAVTPEEQPPASPALPVEPVSDATPPQVQPERTPSPDIPSAPAPAHASSTEEPPERTVPRSRSSSRQTVRVRTDRLDKLLNLTGELVIGQQTLGLHAQFLRDLLMLNQEQERALIMLDTALQERGLPAERRNSLEQPLNSLLNTCNQIRQTLRSQIEQFNQYTNQHHALVDDLEQEVITTRLLPVSTVFGNLPRAVRELANATGKEIELELRGETTELDRKLLEALSDPLLHLVRNAVDHGIESPDERIVAGKTRQGHIRITAEATGGEVRIIISDDGRGIDPQRIRDIAVRKGFIHADNAALLSDQEALELIFLPGFTTAPIITDLSGRGVGMDVVRSNISEMSGQILLESQLGIGTNITLLLPLTLVTTRILLVNIGTQMFALPAAGCQGIIWVHQEHIRTVEGRAMVLHNGFTVPVLRMADLLDIEAHPAFHLSDRMPAVLLGNTRRMLSLLVDRVHDEREAVVKPIGPLLEYQRRFTGAVQLGDGQLILLINPMTLAQTARGVNLVRSVAPTTEVRRQHRLLVTDDSFTTRELIRSILSSAGYYVAAAIDGVDALDKLRAESYDLVVTDVEMPRMNGFDLTANIRQELGFHDLPVIIITSLASDEHKRRGLEVGAQAYIVKSQFNQDNLLEAIQQLLGS